MSDGQKADDFSLSMICVAFVLSAFALVGGTFLMLHHNWETNQQLANFEIVSILLVQLLGAFGTIASLLHWMEAAKAERTEALAVKEANRALPPPSHFTISLASSATIAAGSITVKGNSVTVDLAQLKAASGEPVLTITEGNRSITVSVKASP